MLLTARKLTLHIGNQHLLEQTELTLHPRQRVALLGRNGAGKSTLLRLLCGEIEPDAGHIERRKGWVYASMPQNDQAQECAVREVLLQADGRHSDGHKDDWQPEAHTVDRMLSLLQLSGEEMHHALSGGQQRKVLLARMLLQDADLLLLDEPTNHLDLAAIAWLENVLLQSTASILFVSHDRRFIERLATSVLDLDLGQLKRYDGSYASYLRHKAQDLASEAEQRARFAKKLSQEETWIRQGIKARRTRNEGRVRQLKKMRAQWSQLQTRPGSMDWTAEAIQHAGKQVLVAKDLNYRYQETPLINNFSSVVLRGEKIGIIGPNGSGKTTLLSLLLGNLPADSGTVTLGTGLQIAYADQHRSQIKPERSAIENVAEGQDFLDLQGRRVHVLSYLQDFLFTPERARAPCHSLSGGERNRLTLARLFASPCNLMVLDEPSNDLDIESQEVLEDRLASWPGTLLMVSHDRRLLDNLVTRIWALQSDGQVYTSIGGYTDWERQQRGKTNTQIASAPAQRGKKNKPQPKSKLGYREQQELKQLPKQIENLEQAIEDLQKQLANPSTYRLPSNELAKLKKELSQQEHCLATAYTRWETLESRS